MVQPNPQMRQPRLNPAQISRTAAGSGANTSGSGASPAPANLAPMTIPMRGPTRYATHRLALQARNDTPTPYAALNGCTRLIATRGATRTIASVEREWGGVMILL
jgi:hypothetical protein